MSEAARLQLLIDRLCVKFANELIETLQDIDGVHFLNISDIELHVARIDKDNLAVNSVYTLGGYKVSTPYKRTPEE